MLPEKFNWFLLHNNCIKDNQQEGIRNKLIMHYYHWKVFKIFGFLFFTSTLLNSWTFSRFILLQNDFDTVG